MKFDVCEIHVLKVSNWQSFSKIINREMKENVYKRLVWQTICVNAAKYEITDVKSVLTN